MTHPTVRKVPEKRYEYASSRLLTSSARLLLGGIFMMSRSGLSYASEMAGGNSEARSILRI